MDQTDFLEVMEVFEELSSPPHVSSPFPLLMDVLARPPFLLLLATRPFSARIDRRDELYSPGFPSRILRRIGPPSIRCLSLPRRFRAVPPTFLLLPFPRWPFKKLPTSILRFSPPHLQRGAVIFIHSFRTLLLPPPMRPFGPRYFPD